MKPYFYSLKLLFRRLFKDERTLHEIEIENAQLRDRVRWLRGALSAIKGMAQSGASMQRIATETDWSLKTDADKSTKLPVDFRGSVLISSRRPKVKS